jgi:glycosyltransferase involved in cell wall biosynthesis
MAVYNGEKYVLQQLSSILCQLTADDEVIIIDDCSTDSTSSLIQSINDTKIKYFKNIINIGVLGSFEKSIAMSKGDIIFLSDQDDVWFPQKVERILNEFKIRESITMVASDAVIVDGFGEITFSSFFLKRGKFKSGLINTIIKNKYLGCTLAFRKSLINKILPIPKDVPMHDIWIGAINTLFGKTYYIDEPLINYRRHDNNLSPSEPANIYKQVLWRLLLVKNIILRYIYLANNTPHGV